MIAFAKLLHPRVRISTHRIRSWLACARMTATLAFVAGWSLCERHMCCIPVQATEEQIALLRAQKRLESVAEAEGAPTKCVPMTSLTRAILAESRASFRSCASPHFRDCNIGSLFEVLRILASFPHWQAGAERSHGLLDVADSRAGGCSPDSTLDKPSLFIVETTGVHGPDTRLLVLIAEICPTARLFPLLPDMWTCRWPTHCTR